MNKLHSYKVGSSEIEFIVNQASDSKAIFLIWPCTMGDVRMYRAPVDALAVLQYQENAIVVFRKHLHFINDQYELIATN
mgnify:CR=1 FL=1